MRSGGLSERYIKALCALDFESEGVTLDELQVEVTSFADAYEESAEFRDLLENPAFSEDERKLVISSLADKNKTSRLCRNFLFLLCDNKRTRFLPEIAHGLEHHVDAQKGILRAKVTAAVALTKAQEKKIASTLSDLAGQPVKVAVELEPHLIAGVVIEMEGRIFDGSIETRLNTIREKILREVP